MYSAFGLGGYILVCLYFIFGSAVRLGGRLLCCSLCQAIWPLQRGF